MIALYGMLTALLALTLSWHVARERNQALVSVLTFLIFGFLSLPIIDPANLLTVTIITIAICGVQFALATTVDRPLSRIITIAVVLLLVYLSYSDTRTNIAFNRSTSRVVATLIRGNAQLLSEGEQLLSNLLALFTGAILAAHSSNDMVVLVLSRLKLVPSVPEHHNDLFRSSEVGRGRVIGYIERLLVFGLTISGNIPVIGFVVAAKGFARFRDMDKRDFAEYVLIGTLVSVSAAVGIGIVFRPLIA